MYIMKKTQFFTGQSVEELQLNVNTWLSEHKDIAIIHSDLEVAARAKSNSYIFYVLYEDGAGSSSVATAEVMQQAMPDDGIIPDNQNIQLQ